MPKQSKLPTLLSSHNKITLKAPGCVDNHTELELKNALIAIAQEVQRFRNSDSTTDLADDSDLYKTKLKTKRHQIRTLKENLNTVCMVAKTLTNSKETECLSLNKNLNMAKNESTTLKKKNEEHYQTIKKLTADNQIMTTKMSNLKNFISLGYKELQKIRNQELADVPVEMQLKEIIVCCGQYYADYRNEHEKCLQLEQRNRFLKNKLNILDSNVEISTDSDLKNPLRSRKSKFTAAHDQKTKSDDRQLGYVCSEYKLGQQVVVSRIALDPVHTTSQGEGPAAKEGTLDLSSHMSLVKDLLNDQNSLLTDLKELTDELGNLNLA